MKQLICIGGPTGIGKTNLAISLAKYYHAEIISFDSRQIYKELNIGVNRPSQAELLECNHHLIALKSIQEHIGAGSFAVLAEETMNQLFKKSDKVIAVGGSGLYFKAVCEGLDPMPIISEATKSFIKKNFLEWGLEWLQAYIFEKDLNYFNTVDKNNSTRLYRAACIIKESSKPYSQLRSGTQKENHFQTVFIRLDETREHLYKKINTRVDNMIADGLVEEVESLFLFKSLSVLNSIGYKEIFNFLENEITFDVAIERIKQNTRRYAKRQNTWFKNQGSWNLFAPTEIQSIIKFINNHDLESKTYTRQN